MPVTGSAFLDFVIGFCVSLIASVMNAAGLNLLKLDHVRNSAMIPSRQRNECGRPMWHIGLYLYIASQLAGSTIALNFLKTQWVAPLGSIALIFNFVFAKILVGTQITRQDVYGTIVVMISVVWIVVFGGMNTAGDIEENLTLPDLKELFSRTVFMIYFSILNIVIFAFLGLGMYAYWAISLDDESGQLRKNMKTKLTKLLGTNRFARASGLTLEGDEGLAAEARDLRLKKVVAMIMSACGGLLASQTLLLAKSGIKLITSTMNGQNQFTDSLSAIIMFLLVFTAILQVYCLNTALKLYDSVLVVPTFYGFYTAFGLINSAIYLDQLSSYEPWVLFLVLVGIGALIYGVKMLSAPKPEVVPPGGPRSSVNHVYEDDEDLDAHEMEQRSKSGAGATTSSKRSGKKSKLSIKTKKGNKRQSQAGAGQNDVENDVPSLYGSRRGILDSDDVSQISTVGRERGTSFGSKASFQSDPFRTPKDSRSINESFLNGSPTGVGSSSAAGMIGLGVFADQDAPTHVLVNTNDGDSDNGVEEHDDHHRRQSGLQSTLKALTLHEKRVSMDEGPGGKGAGGPHPRIDTAVAGGAPTTSAKRNSARYSLTGAGSSGMLPSQVRAQLTSAAMAAKPPHLPEEGDGSRSFSLSQVAYGEDAYFQQQNGAAVGRGSGSLSRGHSVRWSTGSHKIDQVFEDLNPFKVLKSQSRDSMPPSTPGTTSTGAGNGVMSMTSSSVPTSPNQARNSHARQDSFTGLPSEWDVPGRKKRHSMLFGEAGRSSGSLVSPTNGVAGAGTPSPEASVSSSRPASPSTRVYQSRNGLEDGGDQSPQEPQKYQNHYFTGTPASPQQAVSASS